MTRKYYSLIERYETGNWGAEFGDFNRQVVADELDDRVDGGTKRQNLKIISTGSSQAEIEAAVAALNQAGE